MSARNFFQSQKVRDALEWFVYIALSILMAIFINKFIILNANIPTGSMEKTIMTGDKLFVYRLSYVFRKPKRFDIAVFKFPDAPPDHDILYIKRIIGLPGEKIEIKDGRVYINDSQTPLKDDFVKEEPLGDYGPYYVPEGSYFMLGDNRNNSLDSRFWHNPFVKKKDLIGKPIFRYSPKLGFVE